MLAYFVENAVKLLDVQQVALVEGYLLAGDAAHPVQAGRGLLLADAVREVVDGHHFVAGFQQRQYTMAADVSRATRDENRFYTVHHGTYHRFVDKLYRHKAPAEGCPVVTTAIYEL